MFTKITDADLTNKGVVGLPDTPNLSTTEMQEKFDEIANDVIIPKFNNLVDEMADSSAAENIGAVDTLGNPTTVQELLSDIKTNGYTREQADEKFVAKEEGKTLTSNDFTDEDKEKLDSLENYELPIGTVETLGGVKPDNETFTIDENGVGHAIGGGGTGTADYNALINKPQINGVTLIGNKSAEDLGLQTEIKLVHITVTYETDVIGGTITCRNGAEVETFIADESLSHTFDLMSLGTWIISEDATDTSETVVADFYGNYATSLGGKVKIVVNYAEDMVGKHISVTHDGVTKTKIASGTSIVFSFKPHGEFTVGEDLNNQTKIVNATVDGTYTVDFKASINVTISDLLVGNAITCSDGTTTLTWISDSSEHTFVVSKFGTWVVTNVDTSATVEVIVSDYAEYSADFGTMSWQGWLESASIPTSSFTDLESVLASETTVRTLMNKHSSVDYLAEWIVSDESIGRTILNNDLCAKWINLKDYALDTLYSNSTVKSIMDEVDKYGYGEWVEKDGTWQPKGNVPIMTSNNAPYGECIGSDEYGNDSKYKAFDDDITTRYASSDSTPNDKFIGYRFNNPINVRKVRIVRNNTNSEHTIKLQYSDDGINYTDTNLEYAIQKNDDAILNVDDYGFHLYWRIYSINGSGRFVIYSLQFYGRELKVSVPTMTSNTEPWGNAISLHEHSMSQYATYKAFDGNTSTYSSDNSNATSGLFVRYDFPFETLLKVVKVSHRQSGNTVRIDGSNDGDIWNAISENVLLQSNKDTTILTNTDTPYKKYRMYQVSGTSANGFDTNELQFYGLDYSEHEERHYIYDHGVEVEPITLTGDSSHAEKTSNSIYLHKTETTTLYVSAITTNKIDLTNYKTIRAKNGDRLIPYNTAYGYLMVNDESTMTSASTIAERDIIQSDLPHNAYLSIPSVNGEHNVGYRLGLSKAHSSEFVEWWLE